jgi:hypothetical protein
MGGLSGYAPHIVAASPGNSARQFLPSVGSVIVFDSAKDGRYIVLRVDDRLGIRVRTPGMKEEHELGWLNSSINPSMSKDGKLLLFTDQSETAGRAYATAFRSVDGGPVARLGEGSAASFSPDGKWALAVVLTEPQRLMIYPVGPGNAVQLDRGAITRYTEGAQWFPDGRRILSCGAEGSQPSRCYEQTIESKPEPITPPGFADASLAPDGQTILLRGTNGAWSLMRHGGGSVQPIVALSAADSIVGWSADSRAVYVQRPRPHSTTVERLTLSSGLRETVRDIDPGDTAASIEILLRDYRDDGSYVYWYWKRPTTLFVASGLATKP